MNKKKEVAEIFKVHSQITGKFTKYQSDETENEYKLKDDDLSIIVAGIDQMYKKWFLELLPKDMECLGDQYIQSYYNGIIQGHNGILAEIRRKLEG